MEAFAFVTGTWQCLWVSYSLSLLLTHLSSFSIYGIYYPTTCKVLIQLTNIYLVFNHYKALELFDDVLHAMIIKYDKY